MMQFGLVASVALHAALLLTVSWTAISKPSAQPENLVIVEIVSDPIQSDEAIEQTAEQSHLPPRERAAINPDITNEKPDEPSRTTKLEQAQPILDETPNVVEQQDVGRTTPQAVQVDEQPEELTIEETTDETETAGITTSNTEAHSERPAETTAAQSEPLPRDIPSIRPKLAQPVVKEAEPETEDQIVQEVEASEADLEEAKPIDLAALLKSVEDLDKRVQSDDPKEGEGLRKTNNNETSVSDAALQRAIREQVGKCWTIPTGLAWSADTTPTLSIVFKRDGTARSVQITDQVRLNSDPLFRTLAESAQRAVLRCKLELPEEEFNRWQQVTMNFHPVLRNQP